MAGTKLGSKKAAETNKRKRGENYYSIIGAEGGKTITENTHKRGFGSLSPEKRREIAIKGGQTGRRK